MEKEKTESIIIKRMKITMKETILKKRIDEAKKMRDFELLKELETELRHVC